MILYGVPGGCSQAAHIALKEANFPHQYIRVSRDKKTENGHDFLKINPKGCTPAVELSNGIILTESLAILVCIADQSGLLLAKDGLKRWQTLELAEFMTTEIHTNFRPFFISDYPESVKVKSKNSLIENFIYLSKKIDENNYLTGKDFTIADAYLFVMLNWADLMNIPVPSLLDEYKHRISLRPSVIRTLTEEGVFNKI
ncbi:glutathione S-transferase N-terminal domain-containing protein [Pantoea stewartii]|uniref:glutathione S-transferase N-terminal domain-containing protein n=1 Tax=Pantoea stewartii TaxID=66269 RepID=UPI0021D4FE4C|nr:glutathione S-transferase N-terminal domain-containing protein [Pantoea stewartii]MCU7364997.1 glutathione S-transferase N-terminal domain-containing protein [Pantoea stewartii]